MSFRKLGNLVRIKTGKLDANASIKDGEYPFFTCARTPLKIDSYSYDCKCVLVAGNGDLNVKFYEGKFDAYQRTYIVESTDEEILNTRYLFWFLEKYIEKLRELSIGGVIKYIKLNNLTDPEIPLPSLEDQKRIVAILDQADALRQKRKQAIALLDEYVKSVFLEMFGDPVSNPKGWEVDCLRNYILDVKNGLSRRRKTTKNEGQIVLRLRDIKANWIDYSDLNRIELDAKELETYKISQNDLLFIRVNGNPNYVGRSAVFLGYSENVYFNDHIMRITFDINLVNNIFVSYFLNSSFGKNQVALYKKTSAGQHTISQDGLNKILLFIPKVEIQNKFSKIFLNVEELKQKMLKQSQELDTQFNALMQRAFNGELTK